MKLRKAVIFIPSIEKGGVERNAIWIANALVNNGLEVDVTYVRGAKEQIEKFDNKVNLIKFQLKERKFLNRRIADAIDMKDAFDAYLKTQDKSETVVLSFQSSSAAIDICRKNGIKVICRLSNHPDAIRYEKSFVRKLSEWIKPFQYKKADLVIANSQRLSDDFGKKIGKKVETIYNPIDMDRVRQLSKEDIEQDLQKEAEEYKDRLIVSIGRLATQKDYGTFVQGIAKSKYKDTFKVWIVGEGSERSFIEEEIKKYNLENTIRLLGYKQNVYAYASRAVLYVQTSLYEGCPNALIEAVATGLPSIACDCLSGPDEVLLSGEGGTLIPLQDSDAVAKAIDDFFDNPNVLREKWENAYTALDRFAGERTLNTYLKLMENLL